MQHAFRRMTLLLVGCGSLVGCQGEALDSVAPSPVNHAPSARIAFAGDSTCAPQPCEVELKAVASDPDGDPLTYYWTGCAGTGEPSAQPVGKCVLPTVGVFAAKLTVSDGHGGIVRLSQEVYAFGSAKVEIQGAWDVGGDQSPYLRNLWVWAIAWDSVGHILCGRDSCVSAVAEGVCVPGNLECRCLSGDIELTVHSTAPTGRCSVAITVQDTWGKRATGRTTFNVEDLPVWQYGVLRGGSKPR
jgi:hypothetical protein